MSRLHGKNAVIYIGAAGAAAVNIGEQVDWSIDMEVATVDASSLNQTWKNFLKGMMGWSGSLNGNFDPSSVQIWSAATSNVAEKIYIYPTISSPTLYYYGTAWIMFNKVAAGSTTAKASQGIKFQGDGQLFYNS